MVRKTKIACSPYLLTKKRSLRDACRQIGQRRGRATASCGACRLADLCAVGVRRSKDPENAHAVPRRY